MENSPGTAFERLAHDTRRYVDLRLRGLKLSLVEKLSLAGAGAAGAIVCLFLVQVGLLFLLAAFTFLLGRWIGSTIMAAAAVGGVLVLLGVAVILLRDKLFSGAMVGIFAKMLFNEKEWRDEGND